MTAPNSFKILQILARLNLTADEKSRMSASVENAALLHYADNLTDREHADILSSVEVAFGNLPTAQIMKMPRLKWLQLESVGFNQYLNVELPKGLIITNMAGLHAQTVAETTLGGLLSLRRGLDQMAAVRLQQKWIGDPLRSTLGLIQGSSAIVMGHGSIGQRIGKLLEALGASVRHYCRSRSGPYFLNNFDALEASLPSCDILVACLPETPDTIGLLKPSRLSLLPQHAVFVNVGRSTIIDETDLVQRLHEGKIAGCVLDVTNSEPLPAKHPLWTTPNTILTQHTGGGSSCEQTRKIELFLKNIKAYLAGRPLQNVINLSRGY